MTTQPSYTVSLTDPSQVNVCSHDSQSEAPDVVVEREHVVPLDTRSRATPLACLNARLMQVKRCLIHEPLMDGPDERVSCLRDGEVKASGLGTRERDVQIKMTQNSRGFVLVNADQLSSQTDHARAAFSGIVAATLSRKARRRVRSDTPLAVHDNARR